MSAAHATASVEPFIGECPACHETVLSVWVRGREVVAERSEVMPEHPCPHCRQILEMGHRRRVKCERCHGTLMLGEPLPARGVAIGPDGGARRWRDGQPLEDGEALHRLHEHGG